MKLLIFDFDGTIADSLEVFIEATNHLAQRYGYPPIEAHQISKIRSLSSRELIQQIPVARWQLPFFLRRLRQEVRELSPKLQVFDGISEALIELEQEYCLGIVTSNAKTTVENVLRGQELDPLFQFIHAGHGLLGKARILKRLLKQYGLQPTEVIYIGDETRDIEAAQQVQLATIAVSWGFNNRVVLEQQQPDIIIDHPSELFTAIKQFQGLMLPRS
ncbi:MAG: HAD-IA family hydrolase [Thermosynechococcaceae cyanobacterium]